MPHHERMSEKTEISASELEFREIPYDAPAATREALERKEAVHPLKPGELQANRLAPGADPHWNKHCYGLFAPGRDIPEAAVYVTLAHCPENDQGKVDSPHLPGNITAILGQPGQPIDNAITAIFYTITNPAFNPDGTLDPTHPVKVKRSAEGLTAGERLIQCVASHLSQQGITNFTTLSPLRRGTADASTGFAQWLETACANDSTTPIFTPIERKKLAEIANTPLAALRTFTDHPAALSTEQAFFAQDILKGLALYYLAEQKSPQRARIPIDPVTHFHLSNGAEIANIHVGTRKNSTESDWKGALGLMVNYRYDLDRIAENKTKYESSGTIAIDERLATRHHQRTANLAPPKANEVSIARHAALHNSPEGPQL